MSLCVQSTFMVAKAQTVICVKAPSVARDNRPRLMVTEVPDKLILDFSERTLQGMRFLCL